MFFMCSPKIRVQSDYIYSAFLVYNKNIINYDRQKMKQIITKKQNQLIMNLILKKYKTIFLDEIKINALCFI